jgi:hypothetical protein
MYTPLKFTTHRRNSMSKEELYSLKNLLGDHPYTQMRSRSLKAGGRLDVSWSDFTAAQRDYEALLDTCTHSYEPCPKFSNYMLCSICRAHSRLCDKSPDGFCHISSQKHCLKQKHGHFCTYFGPEDICKWCGYQEPLPEDYL